jgi:Ca2+-binding RTX toxin-like protein
MEEGQNQPGTNRMLPVLVAAFLLLGFVASPAANAGADLDVVTDTTLPTLGGDATATAPEVSIRSIEVLGPSTARVFGTVDMQNLSGEAYLQYGVDGVLDSQSQSVTLSGGIGNPVEVIADLTDLEPDHTYGAKLVVESGAGTSASSFGRFGTREPIFVSPVTGTPSASGTKCTIVGTAGRDVLKGTSRKDVICGLGGNDTIRGLGGNDTILGGPGRDSVSGGAGADRARGNDGGDRMTGGAGNDGLSGGKGNDRLSGNSGRDKLSGNSGNDYLAGQGGRDKLAGSAGRDRLVSTDRGRGDIVSGGSGRDRATANRGDRVSSVERVKRR